MSSTSVLHTSRLTLRPSVPDRTADVLADIPNWIARWQIEKKETGEVMGECGLRATADHVAQLCVRAESVSLPDEQGVLEESMRALTAYALEFLPAQRVRVPVTDPTDPLKSAALAAGLDRVADDALQAPRREVVTALDARLREQIIDLWISVNDAGGAVGFTPGAARESVAEALGKHEERMAQGLSIGVLLRSAQTDRLVAMAWFEANTTALMRHIRTVYRVMSDPAFRGRNLGRLVMSAVHGAARADGAEIMMLGVRSGTGTSRFYEALGYAEVGRVLGAIRVGPGDDRDDIIMSRRLDGRVLRPDSRN